MTNSSYDAVVATPKGKDGAKEIQNNEVNEGNDQKETQVKERSRKGS